MKKLIALALVVISIFAVAIPAMAATGLPVNSTAYTIKGDVAVRTTPNVSSSNIITRINTGTAVQILSTTNTSMGWYRVMVPNVTSSGYIREDCLGASSTSNESSHYQTYYVNVDPGTTVNARSGPSLQADILATYGRGTKVTTKAITSDNQWVKLLTPRENAYIMRSYLSTSYIGGTTSSNRPDTWQEAFGSSTLVRGSSGNAVINLQMGLVELGFLDEYQSNGSSSVDGAFGSMTETAVINFQNWYSLSYPYKAIDDDGQVGPETKEALWEEIGYFLKNHGVAL